MRVGVITTSRADYGIYQPLLRELSAAEDVDFGLLVSGTHLSDKHGYTIQEIQAAGYPIWATVPSVPADYGPGDISRATGETLAGFAHAFTELHADLDFVIALGDRYEMFAAVAATVPFNLKVVHLHGGETTLGAIDEKYRHAITAMSSIHFPSTDLYGERVAGIIGSTASVLVVGSVSLDGLDEMKLPCSQEIAERFGIDFGEPTILVTMHPETVAYQRNESFARTLCQALDRLSERYQIVVTLPNADTMGEIIRQQFYQLRDSNQRIKLVENFGKVGYFAAMKYAKLLIGNTSSGLLEAPSLGRYAINLGDRQAGRARSANVIDVPYDVERILQAVAEVENTGMIYTGENVYVKYPDPARRIVSALRGSLPTPYQAKRNDQ